jgi:LmbE family N-acetylglucosaminyl deacetylase
LIPILNSIVDTGLRWLFVAFARKLHIASQAGPCLVLAPHPDDETLGCAGVIMQLRAAGRRVVVAIAADGGGCQLAKFRDRAEVVALRKKESVAACGELGVPENDLFFLGFADGELCGCSIELTTRLAHLIEKIRPASVLAPYKGDNHPDHRGLAAAVQVLTSNGQLKAPVFEYPVWLSTKQALRLVFSRGFRMSLRTVNLGEGASRKHAAISHYRSQMSVWEGLPIDGALSDAFIALNASSNEIFFCAGRVI